MVYQVSVAVYLMYTSALEGHALASVILLLVAGATKYGERTLALWLASDSRVVKSCLPISKYLKEKNVVQDRGYVVMGEKQLQRMMKNKLGASSTEGRDREAGPEVSSLKGRGIVTTKDVREAAINEEDYNLCLSHALFKMYMRRFVSLYFNEGDWKETRAFWVRLSGKEAFRIVETEMKFMYDVLFSKGSGTAFSRFGIVLRFVNCVLIGTAGFLILREREHGEAQQMVTHIVISVALLVELFQFCRIVASDWTRVRLICAQVEEITHPLAKVIEIVLLALGKVQKLVGQDRYWSNGIHQHCVIDTCINRSRFVWKMVKFFPNADCYIARWHIHKVSVQEELKDFIFGILEQKCSPQYDSETCRDVIYNFEDDLFKDKSEIRHVMPSQGNLEELILLWHIATTICDKIRKSPGIENGKNVRLSMILSRYCAYLLVSRPRLLPVHPDMASNTYKQLEEQLIMGKEYYGKDPALKLLSYTEQGVLGSVAKLVGKLLDKDEQERWELLALTGVDG
ncbi:hypothetical protein SUGI_1084960 [Cryptomeria japonica]|nr:hypothetical protein SUGI_1084960 [Cryptomeria japonica]